MPPSLGDGRHDLGGFEPNVGARKSAPIAEHCAPSRLDVFRATLERPWDAALLGTTVLAAIRPLVFPQHQP
jgi:hypothetical protein